MKNIIELQDKNYPELLKSIGKQAPKKLYYKGNWDRKIFENCLAVVGSRRLTGYGKRAIERLVTELAASGITIVSGFMYGGDAAAHRAALEAGGKTIAVMPCGIDLIHPEDQADLYGDILENDGLIISELEGAFQPALWTYPRRNRIVAGLSKAVLVIEAGLNSGTLITAELAKKFGRKIFAVPGPIDSEVSKGTLKLIKEGAEMATSAEEILDFYRLRPVFSSRFTLKGSDAIQKNQNFHSKDYLEEKIIKELQIEPLEANDLARALQVSISEIGTKLSLLQLKGIIKQEENKYYVN